MIDLKDIAVGITRVRSKKTGTVGTISAVKLEELGQDRYDSIDIEWDNGNFSCGLFLFWTDSVELVRVEE